MRQRQALVVGEQGQRQGDDGVDRPRVQRPVEDRGGHSEPARGFHVADRAGERRPAIGRAGAFRQRRLEMRDRLGDAVEHQPDAHAGREQHREPASIGIIGRRLLPADADAAQRGDDQEKAQEHEDVAGEQEEPVERRGDRLPQPTEELLRRARQRHRQEDERKHCKARYDEDGIVDVETEWPDRRLDVVLTDLVRGIDQIGVAFRRTQLRFAHKAPFRFRLVRGRLRDCAGGGGLLQPRKERYADERQCRPKSGAAMAAHDRNFSPATA